tara:strand:+ start:1298 stop:2506 length:1209 start_codon:yes stop_codon:yes gene_type:complete
MTTRNFRVHNGISVGDIVISASANTITGMTTSAPSSDGDAANKKYVDDSIAAISSTAITQANSNVTVTDSGTGAITVTADATEVANFAVAATTITATGDINLTAGADVNIPANKGLTFGDDGEKIEGDGTNLTIASSGALTLTATGETIITNNMRVAGNLTVDGTETILNTTTLSVEDNIIEVNRNVSSNSGMPSISGMKVNRGAGSTATEQDLFWAWDETFADDGSTIFGNAGGAFTAFKRAQGNTSTPASGDLVDIRANVVHALSTSAQYADVAERFEADAPMSAGAVVEVGGSAEITETTTDLSDKAFGVISDMPAYAMNAAAGNNDSHPFVAMTGRTVVRVTGAVTKGDRLVTSSVKGCARAVAQGESITPFHVIGRALESSTDAGIKLVNCAVRTNN